ncbi:hypothetical protein Cadr_000025207 [Camelus dromedarius]|uniref:Uncharacterized protein n=1 Tax=Camelus dromedarius TaxID=9838 RepID=A0A5N4CLM4_CAMDR|nr:hypothetical protein Cadr_000025207 [Camelus dromedarius]
MGHLRRQPAAASPLLLPLQSWERGAERGGEGKERKGKEVRGRKEEKGGSVRWEENTSPFWGPGCPGNMHWAGWKGQGGWNLDPRSRACLVRTLQIPETATQRFPLRDTPHDHRCHEHRPSPLVTGAQITVHIHTQTEMQAQRTGKDMLSQNELSVSHTQPGTDLPAADAQEDTSPDPIHVGCKATFTCPSCKDSQITNTQAQPLLTATCHQAGKQALPA